MYISCVGIHNPYLPSVYMWVCGNMSQEELRSEMDADEFEEYLSNLESRLEMRGLEG